MTNRIILLLTLFIHCASLLWATHLNLPPPEEKYNILMLLAFTSESHRNCFLPLAEAFADRGHKVTMLSGLPPKANHSNIEELSHGVELMNDDMNLFEEKEEMEKTGPFEFFKELLPKLAKEIYNVPAVKNLYANRRKFDLVIIDQLFNEPTFPFLEGVRYVSIETAGFLAGTSARLGNVLNPSYVSSLFFEFPRPYSLIQRAQNIFISLYFQYLWQSEIHTLIEKELSVHFPNLPSIMELEKQGLALILANTHFSLDIPLPQLPSQVEVGGMHCRPGKNLPQDLENFINGSGNEDVIYFSLGSVCQGKTIPEKFKKILVEAFGKMKQRIIWKFEADFEGLPSNILISKWLPQQDILAHPKVKLFITHGGLLSLQEAVYHAIPMLAIPVFGDQIRNGQRIVNKGFGRVINWDELEVELLITTITDLISNSKYRDAIAATSKVFRDQINTPLERAVWWSEYIVRHSGAPQLKSPAAELSWIEYLCIDVILAVHAIVLIIYWILKRSVKFLLAKTFGSPKRKRD